MGKPKRKKLNKILLNTYLVLVWLLPAIGMLVSLFTIEIEPFKDSNWTKVVRIIFFFMTMPVYLIYARLIIIEIFPHKNRNALLYFIPYIFTFAFYYQHINENILYFITLDSLPLFLGINLIFFFGLINLIIKKTVGDSISIILGKIVLTLVIMLLYYAPVIFFAMYGHQLNILVSDSENIISGMVKFYFTILLVAFFNIKAVNNLYHSGML
ncbi:MAG: hypothetical protein DRI95_06240 [Bacteroidetes bacterium]|nr:MAG: hypothetical protein DRI95_06240 [Bacteroidota bacterium]